MRLGHVNYLIGRVIVALGAAMLLPLICSLIYKESEFAAFAWSIPICLLAGGALLFFCRGSKSQTLRRRDSLLFATLVWVSLAFFGSLPYVFSGCFADYATCFFESMSGFTTTGASAVRITETLPHGILLWRSLSHWLGGAGVVLIFVMLLQRRDDSGEGMAVYNAEFSGGALTQRIAPRMEDNARAIFAVYVSITLLCLGALLLGGMSFFDAVNHAMSTAATGGFSTHTLSIEYFGSAYIEWVVSFFMIVAGINYSLLYLMVIKGRLKAGFKNQELRLYLFVIAAATLLLTVCLGVSGQYAEEGIVFSLRKSLFQSASIITTTGFASADFGLWPGFARFLLFGLMLAGGCAGSTAGSIKMGRWLVALKALGTELLSVYRPRAVRGVNYNGKPLGTELIRRMTTYFFLYVTLALGGGLLLALAGMEPVEAAGAAVASLGNVGPAVGSVGVAGSYAQVSAFGKYVLTFLMLVGRLELFTVLVLFTPKIWKK
ncbi:MAG: TrkH family potassium uptake protein [Firmicutes bacterium]|nr:TrkH family potassium uptake protein [Bacillota bacterium]